MIQSVSIFISKEEQRKFNKLTINQQRKINEQIIVYFNELVEKELLNKKRNIANSLAQ